MSVLAITVLICVTVSGIVGDRYDDSLRRSETGDSYCVTRGYRPVTLGLGERRETEDCYNCHCHPTGLTCIGFGVKNADNANYIRVPEGCQLLLRGCFFFFVHLDNHRIPC